MQTLLRALLDQRHWQYPTFKAKFEKAARQLAQEESNPQLAMLSVSESTFERWCTGRVNPQPDARRVLEQLFGYSISALLDAPGPQDGVALVPPAGPDYRPPAGADPREMERLAAMAANRALRWAMSAESNVIGSETMAHVHDEVYRLAGQYPRVPLHTILNDLIETQDLIFRLLESGRTKPSQGRDLHLLAAMASGMLAKASHDLGDPDSAMRHARAAYVCADQADHVPMLAWVRGLQSLIAYWAGRPEDARHYAESGTALAGGHTGSVTVWLPSLRARAHAVLGNSGGVEQATHAAHAARDATEPDDLDRIGGLLTFPRPRQIYYLSEAEVLLSEPAPATEQHAQEAVDAYRAAPPQEWAFGDEAGARTNLALARIAGGNLDGAADALRPVLELGAEMRNAGITLSAMRVHRALSIPAHRSAMAARELRGEIEAFASNPVRALPH
jgi:hypothetical protein